MPRNTQGKVSQGTIQNMFSRTRYPAILRRREKDTGCRLNLLVEPASPYFKGHFPEVSILPGVTQLLWAEHFARQQLGLQGEFQDMRIIKFRELVYPDTELVLNLDWMPETGRLEFLFESTAGPHSQGRMTFGGNR